MQVRIRLVYTIVHPGATPRYNLEAGKSSKTQAPRKEERYRKNSHYSTQ